MVTIFIYPFDLFVLVGSGTISFMCVAPNKFSKFMVNLRLKLANQLAVKFSIKN